MAQSVKSKKRIDPTQNRKGKSLFDSLKYIVRSDLYPLTLKPYTTPSIIETGAKRLTG